MHKPIVHAQGSRFRRVNHICDCVLRDTGSLARSRSFKPRPHRQQRRSVVWMCRNKVRSDCFINCRFSLRSLCIRLVYNAADDWATNPQINQDVPLGPCRAHNGSHFVATHGRLIDPLCQLWLGLRHESEERAALELTDLIRHSWCLSLSWRRPLHFPPSPHDPLFPAGLPTHSVPSSCTSESLRLRLTNVRV